jgi:hypothetical protein
MFRRYLAFFVIAITVAAPAAASAAPRPPEGINVRERRQAARIKDGVEDRQLTRRELDKLRADEAAIRAEERVYRRSGSGLNRWERRDLEHDLNRTSREIYRAKHNNRRPE